MEYLRARNVAIAAAIADSKTPYWTGRLTGPIALAIGSEHDGLTSKWCDEAEQSLQIPMLGSANSLSSATAAALLMYEARRQRGC
jgi:TrmH family RNA methyltransferase